MKYQLFISFVMNALIQILDAICNILKCADLLKEKDVPKESDTINDYNNEPDNLENTPSSHSSLSEPCLISWDAEIKYGGDFASLSDFIIKSGPEMLTRQDAQGRTICHALVSVHGCLASAKYLLDLLSHDGLQDCMACKDSFGNTPLHCIVEAQNSNTIKSVLRHIPAISEGLVIRNKDNSTPLDLAFEKKLWGPAQVLAEHQIKGETNCAFLQDYFFKALREQGGVDFLPYLLDLWKDYYPHLDLNFGVDTTGRTPWWYLVNSNDVSVMSRVLQALKNHSIDLTSLRTHIDTETTLIEEAVEKNRVLFVIFRKVIGWCHGDTDLDAADQDIADQDVKTTSGSSRALSRVSSCSSIITDATTSDQSESESNIHLQPDMSCNTAVDIQDLSVLPTSDEESHSESAPQSKYVPRWKKGKGKAIKAHP